MKNTKKMSFIILALVLCLGLMACSKEDVASDAAVAETEPGVENVAEEKISDEKVIESIGTETAVEESTTEIVDTELIVVTYDGIDMESTLPGIEWIETFVGIIDEPKFIVFNDETNKKVIVEDGQIVSFERTDTIAVYLPEGFRQMSFGGGLVDEKRTNDHSCEIVKLRMERLEEESKALKDILGGAEFYVILDNDGEEQQLNCIISLME